MSTSPHISGMTVTQPGNLDDQPLHILPHRTCEQLGGGQSRGDCDCTPPEAGNVWFVGDEPVDEPMSVGDALAVGVVMIVGAASVIGTIWWLTDSVQLLLAGA